MQRPTPHISTSIMSRMSIFESELKLNWNVKSSDSSSNKNGIQYIIAIYAGEICLFRMFLANAFSKRVADEFVRYLAISFVFCARENFTHFIRSTKQISTAIKN